jgi:hypothetical protein
MEELDDEQKKLLMQMMEGIFASFKMDDVNIISFCLGVGVLRLVKLTGFDQARRELPQIVEDSIKQLEQSARERSL